MRKCKRLPAPRSSSARAVRPAAAPPATRAVRAPGEAKLRPVAHKGVKAAEAAQIPAARADKALKPAVVKADKGAAVKQAAALRRAPRPLAEQLLAPARAMHPLRHPALLPRRLRQRQAPSSSSWERRPSCESTSAACRASINTKE